MFVYKPRVEVRIPERSRGRYTFSRYGDPSYSHVDRALSAPRSPGHKVFYANVDIVRKILNSRTPRSVTSVLKSHFLCGLSAYSNEHVSNL